MALTKIPSSLLDTSGGFDLQGNITLGDSEKILLGASSDLQIYHDESGGHSRIDDTGTGGLVIRGSQVLLEKYGGGYMINAVADGASELYHAGNKKLETTSTGATVTGVLTATSVNTGQGDYELYAMDQNVRTTDSPAFAAATINGTLTVTGDLDITGDINSYNVTDLDVTDKTITLGAGQTEANSGGSGIIIDGSSASILWDETNDVFDINKGLTASGNIGFGTSSPNNYSGYTTLTFNNATYGGAIDFENNGTRVGTIFSDQTSTILKTVANVPLLFGANDAEKMRIDSAGNLLVGTTDTSLYNNGAGGNTGTVIESDGTIQLTKSNNITAYLNRLNSDGAIVQFRKDGSEVGSIGSIASDLYIAESNSGLRFDGENNQILPSSTTASTDGTCNLGASSARFNDLYLSGGVRGASTIDITVPETAGAAIKLEFGNNVNNTRRTVQAYKDNFEPAAADTGVIGLGQATNKWKDLYLSGTAYIDTKLITKTTSGEVIRFERASDSFRYSSITHNSTDAGGAFISFKVHDGATATSQADVLHLLGNGNVGIGTTSPAFENGNGLEIRNAGGNGAHLKLTDAASGTGGTQGFDLYMFNSQGYIENYENAPTIFRNNGSETMRINAAGGLSINYNIENPLSLNRTTTTTGASYIRFTNAGGNYYIGADSSAGDRIAIGGQAYGFTMTAESGRPLVFATSNTSRMTINSSGRVSIGTTNANAGLTVSNGDIRTTSPAFANDANSVSMSYESSSTGGGLAVRGPNGSTHGKLFLSVNEGDGGNGRAGIVIEPGGQVRKQYHPSFLIGTPNPNTAGNVWKSNTIFHNNGSHWNNTTGRFTAPVAGYYFFFHWGMLTAGQTSTDADVYSRLNGTRDQIGTAYSGAQGGNYLIFNATYTRYLNANDYVDVYLSSGTIYNNNDGRHGHFGGYLIG